MCRSLSPSAPRLLRLMRHIVLRSALLLLLSMTAALTAGCRRTAPPNVLFIVSDALRADVLSCYGGSAATPNLCGLAARGVLFEHAYATAPWTLPSSVALFTGSYPEVFRHGAGSTAERFYAVPPDETLLAEELAASGYRTEGVVENPVARRSHAMQGIESLDYGPGGSDAIRQRLAALDPPLGFVERDARYRPILWSVGDLLDGGLDPRHGGARPFFHLHWIDDPHAEYKPPDAFLDRLDPAVVAALPRSLDYYVGLGHHNSPRRNLHKLRGQVGRLSAEEIEFLRTLYRLEVESVDERVGDLLEALDRSGAADRTIVVFTSDHGEAFGEHGDFLHGVNLYDELVHVPLIIAGPGVAPGRRIAEPVSHVDLVPTLADLLGVEAPKGVQGVSLRPVLAGLDGERSAGRRRFLYVASPDRIDREAVVHGRYKLIAGTHGSSVELYDTVADPGEIHDLSAEKLDVVATLQSGLLELRAAVERLRAAHAGDQSPEELERIREETLEELRSVGYID